MKNSLNKKKRNRDSEKNYINTANHYIPLSYKLVMLPNRSSSTLLANFQIPPHRITQQQPHGTHFAFNNRNTAPKIGNIILPMINYTHSRLSPGLLPSSPGGGPRRAALLKEEADSDGGT